MQSVGGALGSRGSALAFFYTAGAEPRVPRGLDLGGLIRGALWPRSEPGASGVDDTTVVILSRSMFEITIPDFLTWPETEMALIEPLTVSIRGRVPTRLRRVARWRQGIAALHSRASPEANGEAIRMGDANSLATT